MSTCILLVSLWCTPLRSLFSSSSGVLTSEVIGTTSTKFRPTVEPLLRFPFIHSLANPCGFMPQAETPSPDSTADPQKLNHFDTSDQHRITLAPLRDVSEDVPLDQQVLDFLSPFTDLISAVNKRSLNDTKMKEQSTQELKLVVSHRRCCANATASRWSHFHEMIYSSFSPAREVFNWKSSIAV